MTDPVQSTSQPLWTPSPTRSANTAMAQFRRQMGWTSQGELQRWSVEQPADFWRAMWTFCGLPGQPDRVVEPGETFATTRFCPDTELNVAEIILDGRGAGSSEEMYISVDERDPRTAHVVRRDEARSRIGQIATAMRNEGVVAGDRIAAWLPNIVETQLVMLAAASIGAVFCSTSPDFGVDGVLDRFTQIEPVLLFAVDGYRYGGKEVDCLQRLAEIHAALPTLRRTVLLPYLNDEATTTYAQPWNEWVDPYADSKPEFAQLPFDHPWYILFSSGTTGLPKCIVHRTGGVLLQHMKEQLLHCNIGHGDRAMYFTTAGWMMWNWLASIPALGASAVLYEGSPFHPSPTALFDVAEAHKLTFLGVGAKFIDSARKAGLDPRSTHELPSLRTVASTGSPLSVESFIWVYEHVASDLHLASISGGTDLCACFVLGDPTAPVYAGEIQGPALGMNVAVWTEDASTASVAERGELVCLTPFPSMPLGFWRDTDGAKYHQAYFARFPGVWAHGDFASWTEHGGMIIHGRADTTLNPGGVRIGTAEIYRQVEQLPQILEALVFGQDWDSDTRIILLVRLAKGVVLTDQLVAEIKHQVRVGCTPRHVPARVIAVDDLPRTRSGKLAELAVSDVVNGRSIRNTSALANAEVLDVIQAMAELQS